VDIVKLADEDEADPNARDIVARDNLDVAGEYALLGDKGKELKEKINNYKNTLIVSYKGNVDKQKMYNDIFSTDDVLSFKTKEKVPWETSMFEMMPVSSVITMLSKYQSDIRSAESELVQYLKSQTDASDFRVNKIEALVIPNSKYVFKGEKYSAQIVLSAVDSTKTPDYYVNGNKLTTNLYEVTAGSRLGINKYTGMISMPGNDGLIRTYKFDSEYIVGEPSATISNVDLNVVYRGIDNKFSISVPGVVPENVKVTVVGGTVVNKGYGSYIINPNRDGEMKINVTGLIGNKEMSMGSSVFRIKPLPKPTAFLVDNSGNQITEGEYTVGELRNMKLIASYEEGEIIEAKFKIVSFTMIAESVGVKRVDGDVLDSQIISKLKSGKTLIINNIVAVGPDKKPKDLNIIFVRTI
jgi:gliding motility-associated protein GldM